MTPLELLEKRGKIGRKQFLKLTGCTQLPPQCAPFLMKGDVLVAPTPGSPVELRLQPLPHDCFAYFLATLYDTLALHWTPVYTGPLIQELWNFDLLQVPAAHTSRSMQQSVYTDQVAYVPPRAHVRGSMCLQIGGRLMESSRVLFRTHATGSLFKQLELNPATEAFTIGQVARNQNQDSTHLIQFTQLDYNGVADAEPIEHLKKSICWFVHTMGLEVTGFKPTTNPFTHPSLECALLIDGRPVQLINGGVFKRTVLTNCGLKGHRVGWGCGLQRLYVILRGLPSLRHLSQI